MIQVQFLRKQTTATCKTKLRDVIDSWLGKKTEEIQSFVDRKDMEKFHDALKKVQVGKGQEKAQSEKDSHSKNRGGEKKQQTNNQVLIP